ncbi:hypothetical protein BGZ46_000624 [Entomortierella lignicola]|nr:hypothetical protein BGZ46_000624 [Entomortierella lignicola]
MKFTTFVPAVLGLALFSASAQALTVPAPKDQALSLLKRGHPNTIDALADIFVKAEVEAMAKVTADLAVFVCADVIAKVDASVDVLGIKANVDVKDLEIRTKDSADVDIKAYIKANIHESVIVKIDGHVKAVVEGICKDLDHKCLKKNAHLIVAKVVAKIDVDIKKVVVQLKANIAAEARIRINAHLQKLVVDLGIANLKASAIVHVRSNIDVHLKAFVDACAKVLISAKLVAKVAAF